MGLVPGPLCAPGTTAEAVCIVASWIGARRRDRRHHTKIPG
jgi:hypothetical protein